ASVGDRAAPVVRATPVTPAAADRSSGSTTAAVYDWRAGTSICEMGKRSSNTATPHGRGGISGTRIRSRVDGTRGKTNVRRRRERRASAPAARADTAASRLAAKKIPPRAAAFAPKRTENQ